MCYADKEFDIPDNITTLLAGPSGAGKTTIVKAIMFALFGTGTKVQTYGAKSARVELITEGLHIVRTKRPNRLTVNSDKEDDAGQAVINKHFGDSFQSYAYVQQNQLNSFILMSANDKLAFLERIAFQKVNLADIKTNCKNRTKTMNDNLNASTARLDLLTNMLNESSPPVKEPFPIKCRTENREKMIKNLNIRLRNRNILIQRSHKEIESLTNESNDIRILMIGLQTHETAISGLQAKLNDVTEQIVSIDTDELEQLRNELDYKRSMREYDTLSKAVNEQQTQLDNMREIENKQREAKIQEIEQTLWIDHPKVEATSTLSDLSDMRHDVVRYISLRDKRNNIHVTEDDVQHHRTEHVKAVDEYNTMTQQYEKALLQKEVMICPCCDSKLRLVDTTLVEHTETTDTLSVETVKQQLKKSRETVKMCEADLREVERKMSKYRSLSQEMSDIEACYDEDLPTIQELDDDLEYMRTYVNTQKQLEKDLIRLKDESYSESFRVLEKELSLKRKQLQFCDKFETQEYFTNDTEECICERLRVLESKHVKNKLYQTQRENIYNEIEHTSSTISKLKHDHQNKYKQIRQMNEIEKHINTSKEKLAQLEKERDDSIATLAHIERWKLQQVEVDRYHKLEQDKTVEENKFEVCKRQYEACLILKQMILESESQMICSLVQSINTHARVYLDAFFQEHPISAELSTHRVSKTSSKPEVNLVIEYKGMEATLQMLSGGELSRVVLAFSLALAEIFNTPLLMLDECTANLDQESTGTVFETIREQFPSKTVIAIAHQVVTGTFEHCIRF